MILDDSVTFTPPDFGVTVLGCVNFLNNFNFSLMALIQRAVLQATYFGSTEEA